MKKLIFYFLLMITLSVTASAQPGGDPGGDPDADVPIDGGISILAAAGVAYGAKKLHEARKQKNELD